MAPVDYRAARKDPDVGNCVTIDGKPYLPNISADPDDHESVLRAAMAVLSAQGLTLPSRTIRILQGGATNKLFVVANTYLVRIFGAVGLIDRDLETSLFAVLPQAPGYWGRFANGRIETFYPTARPLLQVHEMVTHANRIAQSLYELHQFATPSYCQGPMLFVELRDWYKQACGLVFSDESLQQRYQELNLPSLAAELDALEDAVATDAPVVFCHNDLLSANILLDENQIRLVDFEYGSLNYRTHDIANHFNEYAGGPPNLSVPQYENLPTLAQQRAFVQAYNASAVDDIMNELPVFMEANHLYWGLWAILQAYAEGCEEYDYMEYGTQRIRQYWVVKKRRISES